MVYTRSEQEEGKVFIQEARLSTRESPGICKHKYESRK
jgi:hypothetical protein